MPFCRQRFFNLRGFRLFKLLPAILKSLLRQPQSLVATFVPLWMTTPKGSCGSAKGPLQDSG
jgi:hypothetical protein